MKCLKIVPLLIVLGIVLFTYSGVMGQNQDWPGWRGKNRDAKVMGFKAPAAWPATLAKDWQVAVGLGDASVSFVNGKLYLNVKQENNEVGLCLDAASGKEIWKTVLNPAPNVTGGAASHPGPRSTPEIAGGKVFLLGAGGIFSCLEANTGKILWQETGYTEVPVFFTSFSPLILGNKCIIHLNGHDNGVVLALDVETGKKIWELLGHPSTYASPLLMEVGGGKIIILQSESDLLGISLEGALLFKIPTPGERRFYNSSTPVISGQDIIVAGQGLGTKSYKIEKKGNEYTFTQNWANPDFGVSFNTPVLKDGYLYGNEAAMGKLYCLNATTGATCWADTVKYDRFASTLDLGKVLLSLPAANGELVFYEPNPKSYASLAKYKVAETPAYSHPLVVGNKIYVKDKELLTCWSVK